jgi:hypothetical protein
LHVRAAQGRTELRLVSTTEGEPSSVTGQRPVAEPDSKDNGQS